MNADDLCSPQLNIPDQHNVLILNSCIIVITNVSICIYLLMLCMQARAGAVSVNGTAQEVADTVEAAGSVVDSATQTAIELQSRSRQLRDQASADAGRSQEYANVRCDPS